MRKVLHFDLDKSRVDIYSSISQKRLDDDQLPNDIIKDLENIQKGIYDKVDAGRVTFNLGDIGEVEHMLKIKKDVTILFDDLKVKDLSFQHKVTSNTCKFNSKLELITIST